MGDIETIDSELRLVAALRRAARERAGIYNEYRPHPLSACEPGQWWESHMPSDDP